MTTDYYAETEPAEIELTGGAWVRNGLTMVWQPHEPESLHLVSDLMSAHRIACRETVKAAQRDYQRAIGRARTLRVKGGARACG